MYGLSFGGGMAVRFLTTQRIPVDRAILDAGTAPEIHTRIRFWVGTDEWGSRFRGLKWTKACLPQLKVVKIPNVMHGEYVMTHPQAFAKQALGFLSS